MLYQSTRGGSELLPSMEIIKQGISEDGGLFVPFKIPQLSMGEFRSMVGMDYHERAIRFLSLFLTDYSEEDLTRCVWSAYNIHKFDTPDIAPIIELDDGLVVLELWHGPTCAFKDMALQLLPYLMVTALRRTGETKDIVILVATSGDTGKAALEGFKDVSGTHIVVYYPKEGVSPMQELQMVTQEGHNVYVVAVDGNFDIAQAGVKAIFVDNQLGHRMEQRGYRFSSANSINWGRLVPQLVYYVSAWSDMIRQGMLMEGQPFNVVVPTGNFGNILAAYYAKMMGIPIHRLICASNSNKVLTDFINTGVYNSRREFLNTISPSMDILVSSNLERLLFELADRDDKKVLGWMHNLQDTGEYHIDDDSLKRLQSTFWAGYATDRETLEAICSTYNEYDYVLDPHTAVGKWVYDQYKKETGDDCKTLLVSTASPYKFAGDVLKAIAGEDSISGKDEFALLGTLFDISHIPIPSALANLKDMDIRHEWECNQHGMKDILLTLFQLNGV